MIRKCDAVRPGGLARSRVRARQLHSGAEGGLLGAEGGLNWSREQWSSRYMNFVDMDGLCNMHVDDQDILRLWV